MLFTKYFVDYVGCWNIDWSCYGVIGYHLSTIFIIFIHNLQKKVLYISIKVYFSLGNYINSLQESDVYSFTNLWPFGLYKILKTEQWWRHPSRRMCSFKFCPLFWSLVHIKVCSFCTSSDLNLKAELACTSLLQRAWTTYYRAKVLSVKKKWSAGKDIINRFSKKGKGIIYHSGIKKGIEQERSKSARPKHRPGCQFFFWVNCIGPS